MDPATAAAATTASAISGPYLEILKMILGLGPIGLVLIIWYFDKQKVDEILRKYTEDMQEMRDMYTTNASLVKRYAELADDLKEIITLSTQVQTQLVERIDKEVCK